MEAPKNYDMVGVAAILNETGCISTDMNGEPVDYLAKEGSLLVARDQETHGALLKMINGTKRGQVVDTRLRDGGASC
jgi:fructose-1,6-bisphosphatase/inositol monophosphatase family enzyme